MPDLYKIDYNSTGLRGFVGKLGRELEQRVRTKFQERVENYKMRVKFDEDKIGTYFMLYLKYSGNQNNYLMEFSIKQKDSEDSKLIIDRFSGVGVSQDGNAAFPKSSVSELKNAADMDNELDEFLKEKFGESTGYRGNGCPLYKTNLPKKYIPKTKTKIK